MTQVKADYKTPDGRPAGTTSVNADTKGGLGTKVDRETGRSYKLTNDHGKITTKWVN